MKRIVLAAAASLMMLAAPAAHAQTYNQFQVGQFTVSVSQPAPGQPITISICCFRNGSTVTFTIFSDPVVLGTATADAQGVATGSFTIPANLPAGNHTIVSSGIGPNGQPVSYSRAITLVSATSATPLARTGSSNSTVPLAAAGATSVVVGAGLVAVAMKRRKTVTA